jgi:hypothetical protein
MPIPEFCKRKSFIHSMAKGKEEAPGFKSVFPRIPFRDICRIRNRVVSGRE